MLLQEAEKKFGSSPDGFGQAGAKQRRTQYGLNEIEEKESLAGLLQAAEASGRTRWTVVRPSAGGISHIRLEGGPLHHIVINPDRLAGPDAARLIAGGVQRFFQGAADRAAPDRRPSKGAL